MKNNDSTAIMNPANVPENLLTKLNRVKTMIEQLNVTATSVSNSTTAATSAKYDLEISGVKSAIRDLNNLTAYYFYKDNPLPDIIKAGQCVPAFALAIEDNLWVCQAVRAYPTMTGLVDAKLLTADFATSCAVLRIAAALCTMGDTDENRAAILTHAPKKVADIVPEKVSNTQAKKVFDEIMVTLTGKHGSAQMWGDFKALVTKRTGEWGHRSIAAQSHVGDCILEYAYLTMNGSKLTIDAKAAKSAK